MLEYQGAATSCKVFTDSIEAEAVQQIYGFLNCPAFEGSQIRIMPDVHAGAGAVIGFTANLTDKVIPNVIGVDLGCGVLAYRLENPIMYFQQFDKYLRANVPSGFSLRETEYPGIKPLFLTHFGGPHGIRAAEWETFQKDVNTLAVKIGAETGKVWRALGTLGGGNHFIEVDRDEEGRHLWLVIHSGSRNFGLRVATYHQKKAEARMGPRGGLAWLEGEEAQEYLQDMRLAQTYAKLNRLIMLEALVGLVTYSHDTVVESVHNFIGDDNVIRKGAISAKAGERVIIPWNMRDGLVLGVGKGNSDWNNSAPHGAGRKMGRGAAKRTLSLEDFEQTMKDAGVWSSCIGKETLDEAPAAYKDCGEVEACLGDTVEVTARLKPVYNFKAGKE